MTRPAGPQRALKAFILCALTAGCGAHTAGVANPAVGMQDMAANTPAFACPWLDAEHDHIPSRLAAATPAPPAPFVPGCAIIRFKVAADGSVYSPALRAANPLNDGPSALAALRQMRFAPASRPDTRFVVRLDMRPSGAGGVSVTTETRGTALFGDQS